MSSLSAPSGPRFCNIRFTTAKKKPVDQPHQDSGECFNGTHQAPFRGQHEIVSSVVYVTALKYKADDRSGMASCHRKNNAQTVISMR